MKTAWMPRICGIRLIPLCVLLTTFPINVMSATPTPATNTPNPTAGTNTPNPTAGTNTPNPTAGTNTPNPTAGTNTPNPTAGTNTPNPTAGTNTPNPTAGTNTPNPTAGTNTPNPTAGTNTPNPTAGTNTPNPTAGTNTPNPTAGTNTPNPTAGTNTPNPTAGTNTPNPTAGTNTPNPTAGTNTPNPTAGTNTPNPTAGTNTPNPTAGTNTPNPTAGTNTPNPTAGTNTPNPTAGTNTPNPTAGTNTPNPTAGTNTPNPTAGTNTPNPTAGTNTPNPTAGTNTPNPTAGTNTPNPTAGTNTPNPTAGTNTPNPTAGTNTPNPTAGTNTPNPTAGTNTPNSTAGTNTLNSTAGTNTPNSTAGTNTPNSTAGTNTPNSTAGTNTPNSTAGTNTLNSTAGTNTPNPTAATNTPNSTAATNPIPGNNGTNYTSSSSSTLQPTSAVNPTSTANRGGSYNRARDELKVRLSFSIKFEENFTAALRNSSSEEYKNKSAQYERQLTEAFSGTKGFDSVHITKFWNGSIGVYYEVQFAATTNSSVLKETLTQDVSFKLENLTAVDASYVTQVFAVDVNKAVEQLYQVSRDFCQVPQVCKDGHNCSITQNTIVCTDLCYSYCTDHGQCFLDKYGLPKCRCNVDDKYLYGGEKCEQQAEKLDLSANAIIAIAAGGGGGLLFILLVALLVTCLRRRKRNTGKKLGDADRKSEMSFQSMTGMNESPPDRFYPGDAETNLRGNSGLPLYAVGRGDNRLGRSEEINSAPLSSVRYGEDGRVYRVLKNSQIYKEPSGSSSFTNHAYETHADPAGADRRRSRTEIPHTDFPRNAPDSFHDSVLVYQPADVQTRTRTTDMSHLRPEPRVGPGESLEFDDEQSPRRESLTLYPELSHGHPREDYSSRISTASPPKDSALSAHDLNRGRQSAYIDARNSVYPSRTQREVIPVPRNSSALRPTYREDGINPLIHDYSDRDIQRKNVISYVEKRAARERSQVYDFIPEDQVRIKRPVVSAEPTRF